MKRTRTDIDRLIAELKLDCLQLEEQFRMLIDIEAVRPAFLSREAHALLDDLRSFRHVFRNLYNRPLDVDRLLGVQKKVGAAVEAFLSAVETYKGFLQALKGGLHD